MQTTRLYVVLIAAVQKLFQEVFNNDRFGFFRRKPEGLQLDELFIVDSSDSSLVYDLRVEMPGVNFWDRADLSTVHNNRIALNMCLTKIFSNGFGMKIPAESRL